MQTVRHRPLVNTEGSGMHGALGWVVGVQVRGRPRRPLDSDTHGDLHEVPCWRRIARLLGRGSPATLWLGLPVQGQGSLPQCPREHGVVGLDPHPCERRPQPSQTVASIHSKSIVPPPKYKGPLGSVNFQSNRGGNPIIAATA